VLYVGSARTETELELLRIVELAVEFKVDVDFED
jgi:hypothetical protein